MQRRPAGCEFDKLAQVFPSNLGKWPEAGRYLRSPRPTWKLVRVMGEVMPQREQDRCGKAKGIFPVRRALVLSRQESHCKFCFVSFFVREAGGSEMHARRIPMATAMFMTDRRGQGWARNDTAFGEYSGD